jgi:hypothetical protein
VKPNPPACQRAIWADADGDSDVDMDDFGAFQACFSPGTSSVAPECVCLDRNGDGQISAADFGDSSTPNTFLYCASGPALPVDVVASPSCAGP